MHGVHVDRVQFPAARLSEDEGGTERSNANVPTAMYIHAFVLVFHKYFVLPKDARCH